MAKNGFSYFPWKSLLWGKELTEKGSRWRVGNGKSVRIYKDRWIPRLSTFKVFSPHFFGRKCYCWYPQIAFLRWNVDLVKESFSSEEGDAILGLPSFSIETSDRLIWHFHNSGVYSVCSGYWLAQSPLSRPSCSGLTIKLEFRSLNLFVCCGGAFGL
ncbi:hypothetical protein Dsin_005397 [Dipteronia sinensis]|uniref:Uncharacterized protein n=1 Tax=Dipteronia sinensis TaxID=43782 RepID=A0AAE0EGG8_9ROSI|nr:hypothetical protein Dsin_005397 [Dipteronia sinensis]